jgi:hypothetical protein
MVMSKRREVGQYWDTHYFTLNEYNPEAQQNNSAPAQQNNAAQNNSDDDISVEDLPF